MLEKNYERACRICGAWYRKDSETKTTCCLNCLKEIPSLAQSGSAVVFEI